MSEVQDIRHRRAPLYRLIAKVLWLSALFGITFFIFIFLYINFVHDLPTFEQLENPSSQLATEVITRDGEVLGRYYIQNRVPVEFDEISPYAINALIATEDERFFNHAGIDARALMRVLVKSFLLGNTDSGGGGSTISQQLAKLLYPRINFRGMSSFEKARVLATSKFKEWITAVKLEKSYTKEEIIAMYLNQFDFIYSAHGIKSAAETYFGTSPDSLKLEEAAVLIGMLKNPDLYNPMRFPNNAHNRRNTVLFQMMRHDYISRTAYDSLVQTNIDMSRFMRSDHNTGPAPYFREILRLELRDLLRTIPKPGGGFYDVYRDGLRVYTTLDSRYQHHAEAAVQAHMPTLQENFFKHWANRDPWTHRARNTTDEDVRRRMQSLERLMRGSERYQMMRNRLFYEVIENFEKKFNFTLRDVDIDRIFLAEKDANLLQTWQRSGFVTNEQAQAYNAILKSHEDLAYLSRAWNNFQDQVEEAFNKPVEMIVFDYNEKSETTKTMSPMDSIRYHRMILQVGMMTMEPHTGRILAWVGGSDFKWFKFDHVNRNVGRQVGSTFKPFVYATAIEMQGISPCHQVPDIPVTFPKGSFGLLQDWTPRNADGKYSREMYTLQRGLRESKNSVTAYIMKQIGTVEPVRDLVANMGIDTGLINPNDPHSHRVPRQPSICLGATDLSVFEMTGAYAAFANLGVYIEPSFIDRIEDRNGNILYQFIPQERQVLTQEAAFVMMDMLQRASSGAGGFQGVKSKFGGKTGTTNDNTDGWFMGITPNTVTGIWVGGDDTWIRFRDLQFGQGARMARPIFANLLRNLESDEDLGFDYEASFMRPQGPVRIELDCSRYQQNASVDFDPFDEYPNAGDVWDEF